jgi:hypothetical protein
MCVGDGATRNEMSNTTTIARKLDWLGLAWLGLAWLGLAWLGLDSSTFIDPQYMMSMRSCCTLTLIVCCLVLSMHHQQ